LDEVRGYRSADDFSNSNVRSVFFGGGTASLLSEGSVDSLLRALEVGQDCEVTLECEPGTISRRKLECLRRAGVNRISVCAQSFDDNELAALTRKHSARDIFQLVDDSIGAGFTNLHVDLMFGIPSQSIDSWERSLSAALSLPFLHLSAYKLFVFKHGLLHREGGDRPGMEKPHRLDHLLQMYQLCQQACSAHGLSQYTLTEFAAANNECRYLRNSFSGSDLLPIGPSAFGRHSFELWENSPFVATYADVVERAKGGREYVLTPASAFKRQVILGLWLLRVDVTAVARKHGVVPGAALIDLLTELHERGDVDFDSNIASIPVQARFNAGRAMTALDKLPLSQWVDNVAEHDLPQVQILDRSIDAEALDIAMILRVARRDRDLYEKLVSAPEQTLASLGARVGPDTMRDLIAVFGSHAPHGFGAITSSTYLKEWLQVVREHAIDSRVN
jgi:oxygen-independent coproporphyrinogen-3 oxidase